MIKYNDLKYKLSGKDKFETKNNFCEQNIQNILNYLSPQRKNNSNIDAVEVRKRLWKNQQLMNKKGEKIKS